MPMPSLEGLPFPSKNGCLCRVGTPRFYKTPGLITFDVQRFNVYAFRSIFPSRTVESCVYVNSAGEPSSTASLEFGERKTYWGFAGVRAELSPDVLVLFFGTGSGEGGEADRREEGIDSYWSVEGRGVPNLEVFETDRFCSKHTVKVWRKSDRI